MSDLSHTFDNLSIRESQAGSAQVLQMLAPVPAKPQSLLSSSLAHKRAKGSFFFEETATAHAFTDDHPEPELLASLVGKEMEGRIIPSSSTISLLSLSQQPEVAPKVTKGFVLPHQALVQVQAHAHPYQHLPPPLDRKNSAPNTISSRNSLTHLHQKRGVLSPPPPPPSLYPIPAMANVNAFSNSHGYSSGNPNLNPNSNLNSNSNSSSNLGFGLGVTPSIPIYNTAASLHTNTYKIGSVPDSPNLDPTSLGGSPSRFWLSSQTPPRSVQNSYNSARPFHISYSQQPVIIPERSNYIASSVVAPCTKRGDSSPILNPVQTPIEDTPMTPLYLSNQQQEFYDIRNDLDENMQPDEEIRF